ncbi:putative disease resistance RPP13-like protein 1 [Rutidosis leptorrhynchoides]|uniref:putative disease resistance RPP13-like protein 1 n=1 Tax=Rutidosis leptorrhynchoides TaxID=125765 RepID=UPI003A99AE83
MAEVVVTAAVTVLIEKLLSVDLKKLTRSDGIESQLQNLKTNWDLIEAVLADANEKHITQEAVKKWLQELRHLAYDIEDVLDDMATETIRRKLKDETRGSTSTGKVLKKMTNITPRRLIYAHKMRSKLDKINVKLDDIVMKKNFLGLDMNVKAETRSSYTTTSLVNVSKVVGREEDKNALLEKLLRDESHNQDMSVVSIVGMGGMGKTTLAQVLYNNETVKDHFELRAWVCVSDESDVVTISKEIYQAVTGEKKTFANLNLLHEALKEKLSKKRFLIVLDDVWSEDPKVWETLEQPLLGAPGSKIIVTTRSANVARAMKCTNYHELKNLSDEYAMSLLAKSALDEHNFDKFPSLIPIGQSMIEKCGGLPLALIAIGRVLKLKETSVYEWEKLLDSKIWSSDDKSSILPALKLSYYDLPSPLKQLFAYCCLFPKDYVFNKNEIVLLWMAEGFLNQPKGNISMESLGREYFEELHSRSIFQLSTGNESEYTMHDLMNDLAISVAGDFFYFLDAKMDVNGRNEAFEKFRHFSYSDQRGAKYTKLKELQRSERLRTFLTVSVQSREPFGLRFVLPFGLPFGLPDIFLDNVLVDLLPQLQFMRVLSLTRNSITEVPRSVGVLKHLRYLNFSRTQIKQVPEEVSELYNLQSLLVSDCTLLTSLPASFHKLINLRHLEMKNTLSLKKTPLGMGGLTSLKTLSKVIIERANGFKVSDLKDMSNLQGELSIKGLEEVKDPQEAMDANLEGKKGLVTLEMYWGDVLDDSRNSVLEYEVFQMLRPPTQLNQLNIYYYAGMKFPSWFVGPSFDKLTKVSIINCPYLVELSIRLISTLEYLYISDCKKLVSMGENEVNVGSSNRKSVLREVHLSNCGSLESYNCPNTVEELMISDCNSMTSVTMSTKLQELPLSLESLEVVRCKNLNSFCHQYLRSLTSLEEMMILDCPNMDDSFPSGLWPPNLRMLQIGRLKKPMSEWGLQKYPTSLVELKLDGSDSGVTSFAMEGDEMNVAASTSFLLPPSLTTLTIRGFKDVESISEAVQDLTKLQRLVIQTCPNINDMPQSTSSLGPKGVYLMVTVYD